MNKTKIMLLASASFLLIMTGGCESKISSEAGSQIYDEKKQYSNDGDNIIDNHSFEKELDVIDNIFVVDNSELIIKGANKMLFSTLNDASFFTLNDANAA